MSCIAVIPARGGSKRIPRKNIRLFDGRPMLAWAIAAARDCGLFDDVIVSTDDDEIAGVAREHGANVPFIRPGSLSDDHTGTAPVMAHALDWAFNHGMKATTACCIYATAPFIDADDLMCGQTLLNSGDWSYVIGATEYASPVFRAFKPLVGGGVEMLFPQHFGTRSQDLPKVMHDAGQFYWGTAAAWTEGRPGLRPDSTFVNIPHWRVQDIDTEDDWRRAEMLAPLIRRQTALGKINE